MKINTKEPMGWLKATVIFIGLGIGLAGCAASRAQEASNTERLLDAAGFRKQLADTPEKMNDLKARTQYKMVSHERNGKDYYTYADATHCKCMYIGDKAAHNRYLGLSSQEEMEQLRPFNPDFDWGTWGPGQ